MGKKYLRIENRGSCPREFLTIIGATNKRDKMDDPKIGGWFGSGTKMAAVAALQLGIEVHVSSHDAKGAYVLTYGIDEKDIEGQKLRIVSAMFNGQPTQTMLAADAFPNWTKPIGADLMSHFRVLREYLRNAVDLGKVNLSKHDRIKVAPLGLTRVYLTLTDEIRKMLWDMPERYFKYMCVRPTFKMPDIGSVFPKSDLDVTRVFSLGTLALCDDDRSMTSTFDYSLFRKDIVSEERIFTGINAVQMELSKLLLNLTDTDLCQQILEAADEGHAMLETYALAYGSKVNPPAGANWREAFYRVYGADAIVASGDNYSDTYAVKSHQKKLVKLSHKYWSGLLTCCGVPTSKDIVSQGDKEDFVVVEKTPEMLAAEATVRQVFEPIWPKLKHQPIHAFEPLTEQKAVQLGFTMPKEGHYDGIFIRYDCFTSIWLTGMIVQHELRHIRSNATDFTAEFQDFADEDITRLIFTMRGIPDDRPRSTRDFTGLTIDEALDEVLIELDHDIT